MDFGKLLSDVEALQAQFDTASKQQEDTLRKLESELDNHYAGLQKGVGALKAGLDQNVSEFKTDLEGKIKQNNDEQTVAMDAVRRSQVDFAQSHSDHLTSLEQKQGELRASIDSALQAAASAASQTTEQEKKIAALNQAVEQSVRGFQQQLAGTREAAQAQAAELRVAMEKMDSSKAIGEMQKRLDLMQTETARMLNSLGGQVESMKTQLEQAKEGQRSLNRIREDTDHAAKRMDKLEKSLREQDEYMQDLANQRVVTNDGRVVSAPPRKEKKSPLPLVAIVLSALAILGILASSILLKSGQDKLTKQFDQLASPQSTMAAQLDELSKQVKDLTVLAQATPTPTPAPTPTPVPTEAPTATPDAEATPK